MPVKKEKLLIPEKRKRVVQKNQTNDFTTFLRILSDTLNISYSYSVGNKRPTKVVSKKNVIKLPLSTFKLNIKKMLSIVNPMIFNMGPTTTLITAIIFIKLFIELANINPDYNNEDINDIYNTLIDIYKENLTIQNTLRNIPLKEFYDNNIVYLLKSYYPNYKIKEIQASVFNIAINTIKYLKSFTNNT